MKAVIIQEASTFNSIYTPVVNFAKNKLTMGGLLIESEESESSRSGKVINKAPISDQYMAVLACQYSIIPKDSSVTELLVSSHMSTLLHVDEDRVILTSSYIPEPVLQEAAVALIYHPEVTGAGPTGLQRS